MRLKLTRAAFEPATAVVTAEAEILAEYSGEANCKYLNIKDLNQQSFRAPD
jgi:hypothetical protein